MGTMIDLMASKGKDHDFLLAGCALIQRLRDEGWTPAEIGTLAMPETATTRDTLRSVARYATTHWLIHLFVADQRSPTSEEASFESAMGKQMAHNDLQVTGHFTHSERSGGWRNPDTYD